MFGNKNRVAIATQQLKTQEFLSKDILDEHFVKVFEPYRLVQMVLGSCRVDIRHRFVTAPSLLQKCYSILWLILIPYISSDLMQLLANRDIDRTMKIVWIFSVSWLLTLYTISMFHTRFCNNELNVQLNIEMHELNRVMMMNNKLDNLLQRYNLITVVCSVVVWFFSLIILSMLVPDISYNIYQLTVPGCCILSFVIELSCASSHIAYFTFRVHLINAMIKNHLNGRTNTVNIQSKRYIFTWKYFEDLAAEWQDFQSSQPDVYLKQILLGFNSLQVVYNFQLLIFFVAFVSWTLIAIEYVILVLQKYSDLRLLGMDLDLTQLTFVAVLKLYLLLILCIRGEMFNRSVKKTKSLSIAVMLRYSDGPLYRTARKMVEMIEQTPAGFCVYGMWEVNARLLINTLHVITSWLITLLQFSI